MNFGSFCGPSIHPKKKEAMENLARYIIRAAASQERMTYLAEYSRIIYHSQGNRQDKILDALDSRGDFRGGFQGYPKNSFLKSSGGELNNWERFHLVIY